MDVLRRGLKPSDIITRDSLENAIAGVAMSGGSTNAVLHLLALAREAGIDLTIDDFDRISEATPLLCDLQPGGQYVAVDLFEAGGVALVAQRLREAGMLHEDAITVTGRTIGEHADAATETEGQRVVRPLDDPIKASGGLAILRGNLAPEGCVVKLVGHERRHHSGPARVFESEEAAMDAVTHGGIAAGDVVIIRNEGPAGGPGMREMLAVTAAINGAGLGEAGRAADRRALLRRHARLHGRPRRARGLPRRSDRRRPRRRRRHDRRRQPAHRRRAWRTRRSPRASPPTARRRTPTAPASWPSTRRSSAAPSQGAVTLVDVARAAIAHRDRHRLDAAPLLGPVLGRRCEPLRRRAAHTSASRPGGITRLAPSRSARCVAETHGDDADRRRRAVPGRGRGGQPLARCGPLHPHHEPPLARRPRGDRRAGSTAIGLGLRRSLLLDGQDRPLPPARDRPADRRQPGEPRAAPHEAGIGAATIRHPWNESVLATHDVIAARDWPELERLLEPLLRSG